MDEEGQTGGQGALALGGVSGMVTVAHGGYDLKALHVRRKVPQTGSHQPDQATGPARPVRRAGLPARLARQPLPRLLGGIQRASQVHVGR